MVSEIKAKKIINKILKRTKGISNCWQYYNFTNKNGETSDCIDCYNKIDILKEAKIDDTKINLIFQYYGNEKNKNSEYLMVESINLNETKRIIQSYINEEIKYYEYIEEKANDWTDPNTMIQEFGLEIKLDDNMKLNKEAINEINYLLEEVKEVVQLLADWGIHITSDPWTATSFCDKEDILSWNKKNFEEINEISINDIFYIGGNIITGHEHKYKNAWISAPKQLAKIHSEIFEEYLKSIIKTISLKHFEIDFENRFGLTYNCGWEHYLCISAKVKESALKKSTLSLIEEIMKEEDNIIELSASPLHTNPKNYFNKGSELIPEGDFEFMIEFFSDLIIDEENEYQGCFGLNSNYIKDAIKLINKVENRAKEIETKYKNKGIKVTVNGLNDGCEKGLAVYVWIPEQ